MTRKLLHLSLSPDAQVEVGQRIRTVRKSLGMSQAKLAERFNLSRPALVNIERGRQNCTIYNLMCLARALRVPVSELLPGGGKPSPVEDSSEREWRERAMYAEAALSKVRAAVIRYQPRKAGVKH